jgi:uncharacterized LabA/DUF88 family protein
MEIKKDKKITYKGNVDAELVLHTMINYRNFSKSIIVSGDGDFRCLIEYLAENNKLLKVLAPNQRYSSLLKQFAEYVLLLPTVKHKIKQ